MTDVTCFSFGHGPVHPILEYPQAGHSVGYLLPQLPPGLLLREITDHAADKAARVDAWPKVVEFIRKLGDAGVNR